MLFGSNIKANMSPEGFERFPNYYFVETGTWIGDGIALALRKSDCFEEIHSIEIESHYISIAQRRFESFIGKKVFIYQGNSGKDLWSIIAPLNKPITFWLDGHRGTVDPSGGKNTPLLEELEQIKRHPIKTHTILIDDMHCCNGSLFDYITKEDIIQKILEINPDYTIYYIAGGGEGEYPDNIMVAQVFNQ